MEIKYEDNQTKRRGVKPGGEYNEVFLATCNTKDDRLLFVQDGKLIMGINIKGDFVVQANNDLSLYKNLKKLSRLELKAILEE